MDDEYSKTTLSFQYFPTHLVISRGANERLSLRHTVQKEGLYYIMVGSCVVETTNVALSGTVTTKNTYGHLPAPLYGELPFNRILLCLYFVVLVYWAFVSYSHSESLLHVHKLIFVGPLITPHV